MRIGEQGVPTVEDWVGQEAATVRDASLAEALAERRGLGEVQDRGTGNEQGAEAPRRSFRLGVDPWLLSTRTARSLNAKLTEGGGSLVTIHG